MDSCEKCTDGWLENYHGDGSVNRRWKCSHMAPDTRVAYTQAVVEEYDDKEFNGVALSEMRGTVMTSPYRYEGVLVDWDHIYDPRLMNPNSLRTI